MMGGQQIIILKEGTEREKGKGAVFNNIAAARAVADAVKSTLGPKGMDKMLVDSLGDVTITNDGVTILKEIEIEHPTAKMLVEVAKTQDDEVGDGTTSAVILAGELLKEAESLIEQEVHPTLIVNGYRMAAAEAVKLLRELAFSVKRTDKDTLRSIARTAMSGRSVGTNANFLADIAVDAVQAIVEEVAGEVRADVDNILVQKKHGGNLTDTTLIDGIVLDKERVHPRMAKFVRDAKIALINRALEVKKTEVNEEIRIRDPAKLQMFLDEEEKTLRTMVEKIKASGANVLLGQKRIDGDRAFPRPPELRRIGRRAGAARHRGIRRGARGHPTGPRRECGPRSDRRPDQTSGRPREEGRKGDGRRRYERRTARHAESQRRRAAPREDPGDRLGRGGREHDPSNRRRHRLEEDTATAPGSR